ncbi:hypothetical protein ALC56_08828 [Trachymyrmex septentrionalis]|uniref:Regulatory protein zeste n=1 Tax=Trachymyrmex septentrionalis TaxID=34720 RepID=A0A195F9Z6_9HYME|nr:PREDICTED: uncharacterized protein LOC108750525 isoform X1 [Trachymyrmex septentrionalis]KYN37037.1 hypothetical protein ALC56_08828 [Trachymyrmex septentrionalis]
MASASLKGTRKTYSFEERKILISLINKHEVVQNRKSDPISICKRKSAWSRITEEYNLIVGSRGARSTIQLRRCWENMKACKRNRDEKKFRDNIKAVCQSTKDRARNQCWEGITCGQNVPKAPMSTGTVGLPPNVVFEPKDSEPFTLQSVCTAGPQNSNCSKKDVDSHENSNSGGTFKQMIADRDNCDTIASPNSMNDYYEKFVGRNADSPTIDQSTDNDFEKIAHRESNPGPSALYDLISPRVVQEHNPKRKSAQREEELHMLALSEAQMKVDIAAMLKEEARLKLEEAHYRKEEARLRMLLFTYKLDRIKDE